MNNFEDRSIFEKPILDPCCGSRMFWFDKKNPAVAFCDVREMEEQAIWKNPSGTAVRYCSVKPDLVCDVRQLPFDDNTFYHIIFDPPHLLRAGENSWLAKKYGRLEKDWQPFIYDAFVELWRVLKPNGTLVFKWAETDVALKDVLEAIPFEPMYGTRTGKHQTTIWLSFFKPGNE